MKKLEPHILIGVPPVDETKEGKIFSTTGSSKYTKGIKFRGFSAEAVCTEGVVIAKFSFERDASTKIWSPADTFIDEPLGVLQTTPPQDALIMPETMMETFFPDADENLQEGETQDPDEFTTEGSKEAHMVVLPDREPKLGAILLSEMRLKMTAFENRLLSIEIRNASSTGTALTRDAMIMEVEFTKTRLSKTPPTCAVGSSKSLRKLSPIIVMGTDACIGTI